MDWAINEKSYTQRKACHLVGLEPKTYRYRSARADDTGLRLRLKERKRPVLAAFNSSCALV